MLHETNGALRQYGIGCSDPTNEDGLAGTLGRITAAADLVIIDASIMPQARRSIADGSIDAGQAKQLTYICDRVGRILYQPKTRIHPVVREELVKIVQEESSAASQLDNRTLEFVAYSQVVDDLRNLPPSTPVPAEYEKMYDEFVSALTFLKETFGIAAEKSEVDNLAYALTLTVANPGKKYNVILTKNASYSKLFYAFVGLVASDDFSVSDDFVQKLGGLGLRLTRCDLHSPLQSYKVNEEVKTENLEGLLFDWDGIRDEQQKGDIMQRVKNHVLSIIEYKLNPSVSAEERPPVVEQTVHNGDGILRTRVEKALEVLNGLAKNPAVVDYFTRLCLDVERVAGKELDQAGLENEVKQLLQYARSNNEIGVTPGKGAAVIRAYAQGRLSESPETRIYQMLAEAGYRKPGRPARMVEPLSAGAEILLSNIKFLAKQRTNRMPKFGSWVAKRVLEDAIGVNARKLKQVVRKAGVPLSRWPMRAGKKKFLVSMVDLELVNKTLGDMKIEVLDISKLDDIFA